MLLRSEKTEKLSAPMKRKMAGWNPDYLLRVLSAGITPA
jgi:hypothetical protein